MAPIRVADKTGAAMLDRAGPDKSTLAAATSCFPRRRMGAKIKRLTGVRHHAPHPPRSGVEGRATALAPIPDTVASWHVLRGRFAAPQVEGMGTPSLS
jgi:hypothetical protein